MNILSRIGLTALVLLAGRIWSAPPAVVGPLSPDESLARFKVEPGMKVDLVAAEPLVIAPVAIAFDEQGRMFVSEGRGYPDAIGENQPPLGRIALLEDTNGDGRYDKRTEYATDIQFPCGVLPWRGGVFVAAAPDILYLKDTDGDGRADIRRVVLTGFDAEKRSTQHFINSPVLGLDNWIYLADGVGGGSKVSSPEHPERPAIESSGRDWRFRPDTLEVEAVSGYGQFGLTFDDAGHRFVCYNRHPLRHVVLPERYLKRNPHLAFSDTMQEVSKFGSAATVFPISPDTTAAGYIAQLMGKPHAGAMTSACGSHIFRGTALTREHYGNAFICEPAQNLVQRQVIAPAGGTFTARLAYEGAEFLSSPDSWFRPVTTTTGPDGALYVCDLYRKMIDHPKIFPAEVRASLDFEAGKDCGRIYRLTAVGKAMTAAKPIFSADVKQLCAQLGDPNAWTRETARRLLLERADVASVSVLRDLVQTGTDKHARLLALCTLDGLGALDDESIQRVLADDDAAVRENGIRLAEPRLKNNATLTRRILEQAAHPDSHVRFQCALTLGEIKDARRVTALASIAASAGDDRWTRAAVLSSIGSQAVDFLPAFLAKASPADEAMAPMMSDLSRLLGASERADKCLDLISVLTASNDERDTGWQSAALLGLAEGMRSKSLSTKGQSPLMSLMAGDSAPAVLARKRFAAVVERSQASASDARHPLNARLASIALLGLSADGAAQKMLLNLVSHPHSNAIQIAAVRALGQFGTELTAKQLLAGERWRVYTPQVREAVLATLLTEPRTLPPLLDAIASGQIAATSVDSLRRNQLMKHRESTIRERAITIFNATTGGDRQRVFEEHKGVLSLSPDAASGQRVFARVCAVCHTYAGEGAQVGPDLTGVRNQPGEALLLHTLVPSLSVVAGFQAHAIETKDGRTLMGFIASETDTSLTVRLALGTQEIILRSDIANLNTLNQSLMPEGLEKSMTKQELRDLIGFLKQEN